jgi:hypothetical protein
MTWRLGVVRRQDVMRARRSQWRELARRAAVEQNHGVVTQRDRGAARSVVAEVGERHRGPDRGPVRRETV